MALHRRAAKRDASEPAIVSALEALGCVVWRLSGKGLPDLIVLRAGKKWLADVKGPKETETDAQWIRWEEAAAKARCSVFILRTPEDAQKMLNNALQPWEPVVTGNIRAPRPRGDEVTIRRRLGPTVLKPNPHYTQPRSKPVDASGHMDGCDLLAERFNGSQCTCASLRAAKEAEATFAPPPFQHHSRCTYEGGGLCSCPAGWKG